ncbi:tyrosine-type recombinase/integrase [Falsiroseomonas tokyonensis]|uniref:Tyrosine-type recombinase/integrase n=1 Tax=Falsiroseomonas tokyonensis TaxID=430521 RepID=A0ABV7BT86_9PROT|nr:site-specific integrase [Falsiroseomonas tokyonensis]MBU8538738.1 site-specific integrase [Falsiroseomonas tokyonensis]
MKLTKRTIDAATCPPGKRDVLIFDEDLPGFALRVTAGGAKVFLFQYRAGGAIKRKRIGEYGTLTPAAARTRAEKLRGQVLDGGDPVAAAAAARAAAEAAAKAEAYTTRALLDEWQAAKQVQQKGRSFATAKGSLAKHLKPWLDRPASALTPDDVMGLLDDLAGGGQAGAAVYLRARGHAAFAWAVSRRRLAANPFTGVSSPVKAGVRDRVLTDAELGEAWRAAGTLGWPYGPYLRFLMLTLQRREEVAGMRWAELAEDGGRWTLPAARAKNGRAHVVHLATEAREVLREAPRFGACEYVFTSRGTGSVNGFARAAERLRAAVQADREARGAEALAAHRGRLPALDWVWHDFRRTGVTAIAAMGFAPHVADRILNHVEGTINGVAAIYQRHEFLPERERALLAWSRFILASAAGRDPMAAGAGNVVLLPRGGAANVG